MQPEEQDHDNGKSPDREASRDHEASRPKVVLDIATQAASEGERWNLLAKEARAAMMIPSVVEMYGEQVSKTVEVMRKAMGLMVDQSFPMPKLPRIADLFPMPKLPPLPNIPLPNFSGIEPPTPITELLGDLAHPPIPSIPPIPSRDLSEEDVEWVKRRGMPEPDDAEQEGEDYRPGNYL